MLKQFTILGIVLLIAGSIGLVRTLPYHPEWAALGFTPKATLLANRSKGAEAMQVWQVTAQENFKDLNDELVQLQGLSPETLQMQQQARLQADLERLAGGEGEKVDARLARALYGDDWQQQVNEYKNRKERTEFILNGSFVLTLIGLIVFTCCAVIGLAKLILWLARRITGLITKALKKPTPITQEAVPSSSAEAEEDAVQIQESGRPRSSGPEKGRAKISVAVSTPPAPTEEPATYQRTYQDQDPAGDGVEVPGPSTTEEPATYQRTYQDQDPTGDGVEVPGPSTTEVPVEHLLSDEKARQAACVQTIMSATGLVLQEPNPVLHTEVTPVLEGVDETSDVERTLAVQTADLERQLVQFKEMVQTARSTGERAGPEPSEPFNKTLLQLNEQISAIREYAAEQQQRVEKLQDGYDWTIVRTFCLRIIRCIDNLEDRIAKLAEEGEATGQLDQVRDELLFALESSGIEPFEPQIQSVFRGQERWAEAIKDKEPCDDPELKGCVAAIVKPGYQYVVDEQSMKVVRAARVKLYG